MLQFVFVVVMLLAAPGIGNAAQRSDRIDALRQVAASVGHVIGAASACREISQPRIKAMTDKLSDLINASTANDEEFSSMRQAYDQSTVEGQRTVTSKQTDCAAADRDLADMESIVTSQPRAAATTGDAPSAATKTPLPRGATTVAALAQAPAPAAAPPPPPSPSRSLATLPSSPAATDFPSLSAATNIAATRGITDREIVFGVSAPLSGSAKELGRQMKMGIETAFNLANDTGGIHGRQLRLVAADDGYEPARTAETMKQLYEKDQVFGIVGNVGTPTAVVAVPYALEHRMLFFGAFTGANLLRRDPPDRYVFNYRASYAEETDAVVRYLVKIRRLRPEQIAVFAQQDSYGDAGFEGVAKALRSLRSGNDEAILRLNYKRNTIDVDDAVAQLRKYRGSIKAVVMVATYRAAAKFIEKTHDLFPGLVYTNVSFVGSTALAEELMLLGPKYAAGVIVTQVVPAVDGYSSVVLDYKKALAAYFPGEAPDYVSLEGYLSANVLIEAPSSLRSLLQPAARPWRPRVRPRARGAAERVQKRLGSLQICGAETLDEPAVNRFQERIGLGRLAFRVPLLSETGGGAQLPPAGLLSPGNRQRPQHASLRLTAPPQRQQHRALQPKQFGFKKPLIVAFRRLNGFVQ
jgi:ABC-type branched-subunit amino acid transport system substrate-binding protein